MEKHFLHEMMDGQPEFRAEPWYSVDGDCIVYQLADEAFVAERVDELLTTYRSVIDKRLIGFQIKGVNAIVRKFGFDGLAVRSEADEDGVRNISIAALLLAAYEESPRTLGRRRAYAAVMDCPTGVRDIPATDLQPA